MIYLLEFREVVIQMDKLRNKKQVGLRFDPKLLNMVDRVAKEKGLTRTEFVERAVKMYVIKEAK